MNKKLEQLTVEEERAREKAIDFYRYVGKTEVEVARLAWVDVQKAFPRLREYDLENDDCMSSGSSVNKSVAFERNATAHGNLGRKTGSE